MLPILDNQIQYIIQDFKWDNIWIVLNFKTNTYFTYIIHVMTICNDNDMIWQCLFYKFNRSMVSNVWFFIFLEYKEWRFSDVKTNFAKLTYFPSFHMDSLFLFYSQLWLIHSLGKTGLCKYTFMCMV